MIGGDQLARGYLKRDDLSAEKFIPDPFSDKAGARLYRTGDLAVFREDGVIEYIGRNDFQVKIRGLRIELGEIEAVLNSHPDITQAVVLDRQNAQGDTVLAAYILGARIANTELKELIRTALPDYMVPQFFVALETLPLNSSGKVDRKALKALDLEPQKRDNSAQASSASERFLVEQWQQLLELDEVYSDDNFFDLGGHSLLAAQLAQRIEEQYQISLELRVFIGQTLKQIAKQIDQAPAEEAVKPKAQAEKKSILSKLFKRK